MEARRPWGEDERDLAPTKPDARERHDARAARVASRAPETLRLQIVRALPLMTWTPGERRPAVEILRRDIEHPQKFVRAWALDGLATFARDDATLLPGVRRCLRELERSGSRALATRARLVRERLLGGGAKGPR
jgi:hypothetical protein